jgi:hypothetical protein
MPRRKPNLEKQQQKKIQDSLESLLEDGHHIELDRLEPAEMPAMKTIAPMDFTKEQLLSMADAKEYLDQMVDFYYGDELSESTDHLKKKKKIDNMHLSSILLQMKTTQHAIMKIMEEIELGNLQPRMLEVLGQLKSQLVGYSKEYQNFMKTMEESYKILRVESEQKLAAGAAQVMETNDGEFEIDSSSIKSSRDGKVKVRGTKALMEGIQNVAGDIQEVQVEEIKEPSRVDARRKAAEENLNKVEARETEDKLDIDEDLFK